MVKSKSLRNFSTCLVDTVVVYNFGTENKRLEIEGITFTDYFEIDEQEKLTKFGDKFFEIDWSTEMDKRDNEVVNLLNEK